jgi:predicted DNA-binding transcriptional regulator AlpA
MANRRGEQFCILPANLHPETRLTAEQAQLLTGRGKSKFFDDVRSGKLPKPEKDGPRFARWRAGSLIDAMNGKRPR